MKSDHSSLIATAQRLAAAIEALPTQTRTPTAGAIDHSLNDIAALRYHLSPVDAPATALIGGTGTGKSTLVNRLFQQDICASSFRRTYTAGPIAVLRGRSIDSAWLHLPHQPADEIPARGTNTRLTVVTLTGTPELSVVDTPDVDGDRPEHIQLADRVFRWADRLCFVVTPEKYQMTELLPYYRLARRYQVPAVFVMNKAEQPEVVEDFRRLLRDRDWPDAPIYVIERDDSTYAAPAEASLPRLRDELATPLAIDRTTAHAGHMQRARDILVRVSDQVLNPLRDQRRHAMQLCDALKAIETPPPRVDVNPLTEQLQRRLQQRSILYLMGPARVLDRVRQVPQLLLRLPRSLVDLARGQKVTLPEPTEAPPPSNEPPDFAALLADQLRIVQSRIDDILRASPLAPWLDDPAYNYASARIDPQQASAIATDELADLRQWLESRWESNPRDTRMLMSVIKRLPGGQQLTKWTESAPYLLAIVVATHHAFFGHIDLMILGGYGLATWLTERISNEVTARTRQTNRRIADRFTDIGHQQIEQTRQWLNRQTVDDAALAKIDREVEALASLTGQEH